MRKIQEVFKTREDKLKERNVELEEELVKAKATIMDRDIDIGLLMGKNDRLKDQLKTCVNDTMERAAEIAVQSNPDPRSVVITEVCREITSNIRKEIDNGSIRKDNR